MFTNAFKVIYIVTGRLSLSLLPSSFALTLFLITSHFLNLFLYSLLFAYAVESVAPSMLLSRKFAAVEQKFIVYELVPLVTFLHFRYSMRCK